MNADSPGNNFPSHELQSLDLVEGNSTWLGYVTFFGNWFGDVLWQTIFCFFPLCLAIINNYFVRISFYSQDMWHCTKNEVFH